MQYHTAHSIQHTAHSTQHNSTQRVFLSPLLFYVRLVNGGRDPFSVSRIGGSGGVIAENRCDLPHKVRDVVEVAVVEEEVLR